MHWDHALRSFTYTMHLNHLLPRSTYTICLHHAFTPSTFTIYLQHNDDDKEEELARKEEELARYAYDGLSKVVQTVIDTPVESPSETLLKKEILKSLQRLFALIPVKDIKK